MSSMFGSLVQGIASIEESRREKEAQEYQTKLDENQAFLDRQATEQEAADIRAEGRRTVGAQMARVRASGITTEGTPLQVMADSAAQNELDAKRVEYAGQIRQLGYQDMIRLGRFQARQIEKEMFNVAGARALGAAANSNAYGSIRSYYQSRNSGTLLSGSGGSSSGAGSSMMFFASGGE